MIGSLVSLSTCCLRIPLQEIEIAAIKAEDLESLDETDLNTVFAIDRWREEVRKINVLLNYVDRLLSVNADVNISYPIIRILATNSKVILS